MGAGAIGSLFGGLLSKENNVVLIGRSSHVNAIKRYGLKITGETNISVNISAVDSVKKVAFSPDIIILTVKSYDTAKATKQIISIIGKKTTLLSLQNGLDNINKIEKIVDKKRIIAGVTTHGALFSKPGCIEHTGRGLTIIGEITGRETKRIKNIADVFNCAGIETTISKNILKDIWTKAIINSSINPLTTIFQCKNKYLLENPVLEEIVKQICFESTEVARAEGFDLSPEEMYKKTREVIQKTANNYSSMLQSFMKGKNTEIDSINGRIIEIGEQRGIEITLNEMLTILINYLSNKL